MSDVIHPDDLTAKEWAAEMEWERDALRAENARLASLLETWDQNNIEYEKLYRAVMGEVVVKGKRIAELEKALGWYADEFNHHPGDDNPPMWDDDGQLARAVLGEGSP